MSRFVIISTLVAFVATCKAVPTPNYDALSNTVLVAFNEAINESIATTPVLPFKSTNINEFSVALERKDYDYFVYKYQKAKDLFEKLWELQHFGEFKSLVVEDVLNKTREKLNASSNEEAKNIVLEACKSLKGLVQSALQEEYANWTKRKEFMNGDENQLKAYNLNTFCKFL